jgi:hypothetical protein
MKSAARKPVSKPKMDTMTYDIHLRVLICREGSEFAARALEMDLLGYGKTEAEAIDELKLAVEEQLRFSAHMKDNQLLAFPAAQEYFDRWDNAQKMAIRGIVLEDKSVQLKARAEIMTFSGLDIRRMQQKQTFRQTSLVHA